MTEAQKVPRRDEIATKDTWDLTKIYADTAAWEQDVTRLEGLLPEVAAPHPLRDSLVTALQVVARQLLKSEKNAIK